MFVRFRQNQAYASGPRPYPVYAENKTYEFKRADLGRRWIDRGVAEEIERPDGDVEPNPYAPEREAGATGRSAPQPVAEPAPIDDGGEDDDGSEIQRPRRGRPPKNR